MTQASLAFSSFVSFSHMIFAFMAQISSPTLGAGRYDFFSAFPTRRGGKKDILRHNSRKNEKQDKKASMCRACAWGLLRHFVAVSEKEAKLKAFVGARRREMSAGNSFWRLASPSRP
jgi:hypothetical protein